MKLSIIIPVNNVEKYISHCLDSVLQQDIPYSEYEVIVVNDGSPDNSATIIAEYEKKYPNIVHVSKENGGLSSARNAGLKLAKGEYIWFIDSDDWIEKKCLKSLLEYSYKNNLDLCEFSFTEVYGNTLKTFSRNKTLHRYTVTNLEYINIHKVAYSAWTYIVKRDIIIDNKLFFIEGILHEDREFNIRLLEHCRRISFYCNYKNGLYYYRRDRDESIISDTNPSQIIKRVESYIKILQITKNNYPYDKNVKNYAFYVQFLINGIIASLVDVIKYSAIRNKGAYYRKVITENNINYCVDVFRGKAKIKYSVLSVLRKNLHLTILALKLFDAVGGFLSRIKK